MDSIRLEQYKQSLIELKARRNVYQSDVAKKTALLASTQSHLEDLLLTQGLIQEASQMTLECISIRINTIVTKALAAVLPEPYTFELSFRITYGKLSTDMKLKKDGRLYALTDNVGDGVVDIVALALRVAILCLDKRKLRRCLLLDEPVGALSVDYQPLAGRMLEHLSKALGMQIIMVAAHGSNYEFEDAVIFDSKNFTKNNETALTSD